MRLDEKIAMLDRMRRIKAQEEREEEREKQRLERENAHYTRIDELLREKLPNKRKKHSIFELNAFVSF